MAHPPRSAALALAALLSACGEAPPAGWSGYAEGDYVYVAAPLAGRAADADVQAGQHGARAARRCSRWTTRPSAPARDEAQARARGAQAQAANTESGRRREEIAVTARAARAGAGAGGAGAQRTRTPAAAGRRRASSRRRASTTRAPRVEQTRARVAELEAALRVARLPARRDERAAARAQAEAAQPGAARKRLARRSRSASARRSTRRWPTPTSASASTSPAGQPVLALLPRGEPARRASSSPRPRSATLAAGQAVTLHVRRLRRADRRAHQPHRHAGRVHAAGDLLERAARQAGVPGRGAARAEGRDAAATRPAARRAPRGALTHGRSAAPGRHGHRRAAA